MTLKRKILALLIAFSAIPAICISGLRLYDDINIVGNLHMNRMNSIAHISSSAFNEIVDLRKEEVSMLGSSLGMRGYLTQLEINGEGEADAAARESLEQYFNLYIESLGVFSELVFLNPDGVVSIACYKDNIGKDLSDYDYFVRVIDQNDPEYVFCSKVHDSLIYPGDPAHKRLGLSKSFWSKDGRLLGVLVAFINTTLLTEFTNSISFGDTGISFVIDQDNYILYHPDARFYNSYTASPQLNSLLSRWKIGEIEDKGLIEGILDGKRVIYYYEIMHDIEMVFILRQDHSEYYSEAMTAVTTTVVLTLIFAGIAVAVSIPFARSVVNPVETLKKSFASGAKEGKYVVCKLNVNNELGDMAKSYNTLIRTLEKQYAEIKEEKDKNEYNALHDRITGLFNREAFEQRLAGLLRPNRACCVFLIDIKNLKHTNDLFGHALGDALLKSVGERLLCSSARFGICARFGSDEFVLTKEGGEAEAAVKALMAELSEPFVLGEVALHIQVSVGVSLYPENGVTVERLITNADLALHKAKETGGYCLYENKMRGSLDRKNSVMQVLRTCVRQKEIFLMYQPVYDSKTQNVIGFEALMRIKSAHLGLISPVEFIPLAESDTSLIEALGGWVLNEAARFIGSLIKEHGFDGFVSVNVSSIQLGFDNFADTVIDALNRGNVSPRHLQLEITESAMMGNNGINIQKLNVLRELGASIALDNFGARYSSFFNMIKLPLDALKIDPVFYQGAGQNERVAEVNRSIIDLAHKLRIKTVAVSVETQEDFDTIRALGYDVIQGFLFSRPLMESSVRKLLGQ